VGARSRPAQPISSFPLQESGAAADDLSLHRCQAIGMPEFAFPHSSTDDVGVELVDRVRLLRTALEGLTADNAALRRELARLRREVRSLRASRPAATTAETPLERARAERVRMERLR
jgi:hypothetical protein